MTKTITRADIVTAIFQEVGFSRVESAQLLEEIIDEMIAELAEGNRVKISSFGSFKVRQKRERMGRNPRTGESALITSRKVLTFRPSEEMKQRVSG
ncbi:MAG: integration host factor subunit alpha [Pseudomonadota bacterium]